MGIVTRLHLHNHPKLTHLWSSAEGLPVGVHFCPLCWAPLAFLQLGRSGNSLAEFSSSSAP